MYISIDLGGTNTRIASSKDLIEILDVIKVKTEQDVELERNIIDSSIKKLCDGEEIEGLCIGVPGLIDKEKKIFEKIPNIPAFDNISFEDFIGNISSLDSTIIENDASLAGLGEAVRGAGKNYNVVAYLTLSTGVGGVRISGKKLDPYQGHSEPGHMVIEEGGKVCEHCHQAGCLSAYTSGKSFEKNYGTSSSECTDQDIWNEYANKLSLGLINIMADWGPEVIVLGGSISNKFEEYFKKPLLEELKKQDFFEIPPIVKSELDDNSGIYGGFEALKQAGFLKNG
ncbi:ROK family protein [Patescibacteria group bacterium]